MTVAAKEAGFDQDSFTMDYNCGLMKKKAVKMGLWHDHRYSIKKLEPGDLVLYDWSGRHRKMNHVGIIYSVNKKKKTIKVIEGNINKGTKVASALSWLYGSFSTMTWAIPSTSNVS